MADKALYANDLIHRYASHTFTETTTNDIITVTFKNASSVTIAEAKGMTTIIGYRKIRNSLLAGQEPVFLSTTAQRDALTSVDDGTSIQNTDNFGIEVYRSSWFPSSNWIQGTIKTATTTDATQTTIDTLTLDDESVYLVRASIVTIESGGGDLGGGEIICLAKRLSAGNAAIQGSVEDILRRGTNGSLDFTFTVSGNDLLARVTGLASTTMKWESILKYRKLSG